MADYGNDAVVSVPVGDRTALDTALTNAAAGLPAASPWKDAFTKLAAGAATNRWLAGVSAAHMWAVNNESDALRDAAVAVLANTTGVP